MSRRRVVLIVGVAALVIVVVGVTAMSLDRRNGDGRTLSEGLKSLSPVALPNASPVASPAFIPPLPGTPVDSLPAVIGITPTQVSTEIAWSTYENSIMGISLRFPSGWTYVETADRLGVAFYPPGTDPSVPSPLIAFGLAPARAFDPTAAAPIGATTPTPISVAGVTGRRYEDNSLAVPYQSASIELPHRGGTLVLTATLGPTANLVPVLEQVLPTIVLSL